VTNVLPPEMSAAYRQKLVPGYEMDPRAVGVNREVDPEAVDDRDWAEVHGLTEDDVAELTGQQIS